MLEAADLGIGSIYIACGEKTFETPEGQALMKKWGLGEEYQCHSIVSLGYIAKETPTHARKENRIIYDQPK